MDNIEEALRQHRPMLIERYEEQVRRTFAGLIERHGTDLKGIYNSRYYKAFESLQGLIKCVYDDDGKSYHSPSSPRHYELLPDRLHEKAEKYADSTIEVWKQKIEFKLGLIEDASCERLNSTDFLIMGTKNGKKVVIEQHMIVNVSKHGLLFNQFPARIKYDGKSISEKKFKEVA